MHMVWALPSCPATGSRGEVEGQGRACSHSMHQPRTANLHIAALSIGRPRALKMIVAVSTTMSPRVILPPLVLYSSMWWIHSFSRCGSAYILGSSSLTSAMSMSQILVKEPLGSLMWS